VEEVEEREKSLCSSATPPPALEAAAAAVATFRAAATPELGAPPPCGTLLVERVSWWSWRFGKWGDCGEEGGREGG
jgi:hypothetical protein